MAYKLVRQTMFGVLDKREGPIIAADRFKSLVVSIGGAGVYYTVGVPTVPKDWCGPLAAFKTLQDVEQFVKENGHETAALFRCRVKKDLENKYLLNGLGGTKLYTLPKGTVLCKEITLTKLIRHPYSMERSFRSRYVQNPK